MANARSICRNSLEIFIYYKFAKRAKEEHQKVKIEIYFFQSEFKSLTLCILIYFNQFVLNRIQTKWN